MDLLHIGLTLTKFFMLFWAIVFSAKYITLATHSLDISPAVAYRMGIGAAGFITLQWLL